MLLLFARSASACASANMSPISALNNSSNTNNETNLKKAILNAKKMNNEKSVESKIDHIDSDAINDQKSNLISMDDKDSIDMMERLSLRSKHANMTTSSLKTVSQQHLNESNSFNTTDLSLINGGYNNTTSNGAASTSGISSLYTTSDLSGVDLSMDSVVDKFSEEYNDLSSKIMPINEEGPNSSEFFFSES